MKQKGKIIAIIIIKKSDDRREIYTKFNGIMKRT